MFRYFSVWFIDLHFCKFHIVECTVHCATIVCVALLPTAFLCFCCPILISIAHRITLPFYFFEIFHQRQSFHLLLFKGLNPAFGVFCAFPMCIFVYSVTHNSMCILAYFVADESEKPFPNCFKSFVSSISLSLSFSFLRVGYMPEKN